jgi:ABC-type transport system involved in multi-copper enzyme maturation permease subunit
MFILTRVAPEPGEKTFQALIAMIPKPLLAMLGGEVAMTSARGIIAFGYIHPFFLAILTAWVLRTTSGALAGEIGHGTMELIASRPVSRAGQVIATWALAAAGVVLLAGAAWLGTAVGLQVRALGVSALDLASVPAAGALMFMAWTSVSLLFSALNRDAGPAIAWASGLIVVSFVVVFLAQVWPPAEMIRPLSLFAYYLPQEIVLRGVSTTAVAVLATVTVAALGAAVAVFGRRDLS